MVFIEAIGDGIVATDTMTKQQQQQRQEKEEEKDDDNANRSCNVCGGTCTTRCSVCRLVYYCSVECQRTDWNEGGHKKTCMGNRKRRQTKKNMNMNMGINKNNHNIINKPPIIGPSLPPPSSVHNEDDANRVLQELWSMEHTELSSASIAENETQKQKTQKQAQKEIPKPCTPPSLVSTNASTTPEADCQQKQQQQQQQTLENSSNFSAAVTPTSATAAVVYLPDPTATIEKEEKMSFVVEEMPQICRFQLTLTPTKQQQHTDGVLKDTTSILVSAEPLKRSGARTLVTVRGNDENNNGGVLFAGEFPRPILASEITWRVATKSKSENDDLENAVGNSTSIVFRIPYPYDPSNTSSLALGGSLVTQHSSSGGSSSSSLSTSTSSLDEVNRVLCGTCHMPLVMSPGSSSSISNSNKLQRQQAKQSSQPASATTINRVFPLPQGHWDEIADYLICYDGQPVVDFSAGSECAEPSIALQDASLLCFHRRDVEGAVCALAVDGYGCGELTNSNEGNNNNANDDNTNANASSTSNGEDDLGTFFTKSPSSSFVLPNLSAVEPPPPPPTEAADTSTAEEKKDDNNGEPPISASSAVVRGDRTWQDAADGDSVSLCCSRCCSPLGFASLGSPETWRFWKHRLSIQTKATRKAQHTPMGKAIEEEKEGLSSNNMAVTMSFAATFNTTKAKANRSKAPFTMVVLPTTKPLGSCSSFLARELVRYAESKAIFTFVVRRDAEEEKKDDDDKCLLLRLLSWETAMATSFVDESAKRSSPKPSPRLRFTKVAKIVFEETADPTANAKGHLAANHQDNGGATQWFWGGVDLCCPPPSPGANANATITNTNTNNSNTFSNDFGSQEQRKSVSTARLQLPKDEYDRVLEDLVTGRSLFEKEMADATILLKMGGIWKGLGLTAVALE